MNLYIRSQSKRRLEKMGKLFIDCEDFEEKTNSRYCICNDKSIMGTFKTKKRALEVLDNIQKMLEDETIETEIRYIDNQEYERIVTKKPNIPKDKAVYEIPEE